MARLTALQLYKYLPGTNCGKCEEKTCMGFAVKLVEKEEIPDNCPELKGKKKEDLIKILIPPVRDVLIGSGNDGVMIGGEEVMYRHELRFFNQAALMLDVSDLMSKREIKRRIDFVKEYRIERIGEELRLDGISIRCASNDREKFRGAVGMAAKEFPGPLMLCSFNPEILAYGMQEDGIANRRPLLYAANNENWEDMLELSKKYDAPLAVYSENLDGLGTLVRKVSANAENFHQIVLDPGVEAVGAGLLHTLDKFAALRKSALKNVDELRYPLMASTVCALSNDNFDFFDQSKFFKNKKEQTNASKAYYEAILAGTLMDRFASLLVIHSTELWSILPTLYLRQNIYTDPRVEPAVEAKLYEFGDVNENSPVLLTTNFALTYYAVTGDMETSKIPYYLLVVDSEGLAVLVALAGGKLTASGIKKAIDESGLEKKVTHRKLIIPGVTTALSGAIEDETGWKVLIGPRDSSMLGNFLKEKWA
ncbi:MAG: hypothetical protein A7316_06010 [Candidatus Altiarchaeales archaeon WOR_SM1_86-2]|nr:MAG: hypothetical protein A7316_06010 [Candidatus Altiarchaeales archaeon WOR_SM1_86-2]ODS41755.1 MAG: hypothetical protein A7315_00340 [Candidatus Altiarchaeales archaeon WOR_SM1_79]